MLDFVHCEHCEKISWSDKKAGPQCTPDPVTAQHIRTVVSFKPVRNRPTQSLAPGTEPERPGSFCWTALQTCWRASWSFCRLCDLQCVDTEDKEFVLLFLFLTSFDFVTSFDICRQKRVQQTLCVVFLTPWIQDWASVPRRPESETSVLNVSPLDMKMKAGGSRSEWSCSRVHL